MFRLGGWRLAVIVATPPLLQKTDIGKTLREPPAGRPSTRRFGTVISFMHRRGYGFLREMKPPTAAAVAAVNNNNNNNKKKGISDAAEDDESTTAAAGGEGNNVAHDFFFPRSSLDGGFYVTEGQTVAFDVRLMQPSKQMNARIAEAKSSSASSAPTTATASEEEEVAVEQPKQLSVANHIRLYDVRSGKEKSVTPIMLFGYVENWDPLAGNGVIAELDLTGSLHDDAPRFTVALEDLDLAGRTELRRGRYVRFCLERGDRTAARRVIIDRGAEKKHEKEMMAAVGDQSAGGKDERFYGTVREIVENRFGFILLDGTGESIFFHLSNAEGGDVKPGDTVSFIMREVLQGKHAGKRTCMRVKKYTARTPAAATGGAAVGGASTSKVAKDVDDDDEFELLD